MTPHPKKRVLRALGLRDPNLYARKSEFQWGKHIGSGTFGEVFQCTWLAKDPPVEVAVKVTAKSMIPNLPQHTNLLNRVLKFHHSHVVSLLDWFQSKDHLYMVFELAQGGELFDHTIEHGHFSDKQTCQMIRDVCGAVSYIHAQGMVHRDLKPENLFVRGRAPYEPPYDLVVADFGVAAHVLRLDGTQMSLMGICGSPGYTAPEVYKREQYGQPVDIWAIGVLTFILLSGRFPFANLSGAPFLKEVEQGSTKFPKRFGITPEAEDFILGCLQLDPSKRWTAEEALEHRWFAQLDSSSSDRITATESVADTDYTRCDLATPINMSEYDQSEQKTEQLELAATDTSTEEASESSVKSMLRLQRRPTISEENQTAVISI